MALLVVFGLMFYIKGTNLPLLPFVSLLPTLCLLFIFCWSLAVLAGFANVYFQDTQHLCEVGFQILFYMTPIIYPESLLRAQHLAWLADCNPVRALIDLVRKPILYGELPSTPSFVMATLTAAVLAAAASYTLARLQKRLIFSL